MSYESSRTFWVAGMAGLALFVAVNRWQFGGGFGGGGLLATGAALYANPGQLAHAGKQHTDAGNDLGTAGRKMADDVNNKSKDLSAEDIQAVRKSAQKLSWDITKTGQNHVDVGSFLNGAAGMGHAGIMLVFTGGTILGSLAVLQFLPYVGTALKAANLAIASSIDGVMKLAAQKKKITVGAAVVVLGLLASDNISKRSSFTSKQDAKFTPIDLPLSNPTISGTNVVPGAPTTTTRTGTTGTQSPDLPGLTTA